jgi:hypothetical protein
LKLGGQLDQQVEFLENRKLGSLNFEGISKIWKFLDNQKLNERRQQQQQQQLWYNL